jgi:serine phosphatase RsbU (regulator of sigma subunit)
VTFFFGCYSPATGRFVYVNAGHNPPLMVSDGQVTPLKGTGVPVGLVPNGTWHEAEVVLPPGGSIVFYTDGLTEASSPDDEEFGNERFSALAASLAGLPAAEVIAGLLAGVTSFEGGSRPADDKTLVVLRRQA